MKWYLICLLFPLLRFDACTSNALDKSDENTNRGAVVRAAMRADVWRLVFAGKSETDDHKLREISLN
ncbi:MAG: hypothetical protein AAFU03_18235, partial [Bacteroidota bacterium]